MGDLGPVGRSRSQPSRWHSGICSGPLPMCRCTCRGTPFPSARRWLWPTWLLRLGWPKRRGRRTERDGRGDIQMSSEMDEYRADTEMWRDGRIQTSRLKWRTETRNEHNSLKGNMFLLLLRIYEGEKQKTCLTSSAVRMVKKWSGNQVIERKLL